jgi:hypothetical protein
MILARFQLQFSSLNARADGRPFVDPLWVVFPLPSFDKGGAEAYIEPAQK